MTVKELIKILSTMDENLHVQISVQEPYDDDPDIIQDDIYKVNLITWSSSKGYVNITGMSLKP